MGTHLPSQKGYRASTRFRPIFYCGQRAGYIKMPLDMEVDLSPGDFVLDGDPAPTQKGAVPRIFGPCLLWPNGCMDKGAIWYLSRPRSPRHCIRWEPAPAPLNGHSPQFFPNVRFGQTAGWTKMPLGTEVGLGPGDLVLDGDPATSRKKGATTPPNFWPVSIVAKRLDGPRCHLVRR